MMNARIARSFALNLRLLAITVLVILACSKGESRSGTDTANKAATNSSSPAASALATTFTGTPCGTVTAGEACVTLKVTGLAHLVDGPNPATLRTLVVPDMTSIGHETLLLTTTDFVSTATDGGLLDKHDEQLQVGQSPGQGQKFFFRTFPAGHEIDLEKSGWTKPASPVLVADESGDPNAECVDTTTAPKESLHWLPRLTTVSKYSGTATVKTEFTKKDPLATDVVTRLEFVDGTLKAGLGTPFFRYAFQRNGVSASDDHVQGVASELRYSFKAKLQTVTIGSVTEDVVVLVGRKFGSSSTFTDIARVKPVDGSAIIVLANVVKNDFFHPVPVVKNDHFKHLYAAFDSTTTIVPTVPVKGTACPPFPADSGVECGPDRLP